MLRATFKLNLQGDPAEVTKALDTLATHLDAEGLVNDEDWEFEYIAGQAAPLVVLKTQQAIRRTLEALDDIDAYMVETE